MAFNTSPLISIVTPVFNGALHLGRTLESISHQSSSVEHIVMDGGSTDATPRILEEHFQKASGKYVSGPDQGVYDAVQKGFSIANGEIFAWLNAGDAYLPWTLHTVEKVFASYPEIDWITGVPCLFLESNGFFCASQFTPVYSQGLIRRGFHNGRRLAVLQQESMFWRRRLWEKSNGAEVLRGKGRGNGMAADFHLWRRFAQHSSLHTVCSPLASFTVTEGQLSQKYRAAYFADMGVNSGPYVPNRWYMLVFRIYSSLRLGKCIHLDALRNP